MKTDDNGGAPTWNGDPASFEAFATACKWYTLSLKESEKAGGFKGLATTPRSCKIRGAASRPYGVRHGHRGAEVIAFAEASSARQLFEAGAMEQRAMEQHEKAAWRAASRARRGTFTELQTLQRARQERTQRT